MSEEDEWVITNASVWRKHAGLLIPEDVVPWTREELARPVVSACDPEDFTLTRADLERLMWLD
jgi:hypothetical protein